MTDITLAAALARTDEFLADLGHGTTSVRNMRELRALADAVRAHLAEAPKPDAGLPGGYTRDQLQAAWALVPKHPSDWKGPIDGHVPDGTDLEAMSAAIAFFCGSPSEFSPDPDGGHTVHAPGYHVCIGS